MLNINVHNSVDIECVASDFIKSVNILMADLGSVSSSVLITLFIQYCCSFHGVVLCDLRSESVKKLNVLWRKALKRIYKIPIRTHNKLLSIIYEKRSLNACLAKRIIKFYYQMINSDNCIVRTVAHLCRHQCISNMGRNLT